jgi:hypothetical protein
MLQYAGYEVPEAVNGRQGLRLFYEKPISRTELIEAIEKLEAQKI